MSICSHTVLYTNGTRIEKETGEHLVLDPKTTLEKILYDEGIDLSAWAKMYKKELFLNFCMFGLLQISNIFLNIFLHCILVKLHLSTLLPFIFLP